MNLTKVSKKLIIDQFVDFQRSVDECAAIYGKRRDQIEQVLRDALIGLSNDHFALSQMLDKSMILNDQADQMLSQVIQPENPADVSDE